MPAEGFLGRKLLTTLWAVYDRYLPSAVASGARYGIVSRLGRDYSVATAPGTRHCLSPNLELA
jgi:hypothetical protein